MSRRFAHGSATWVLAGGSIVAAIGWAIREIASPYPAAEVGASIGVAWSAVPPEDAETLVHAADETMYRAKVDRKGTVVVEVVSHT
jgi:predicted signal transduction protein with EAL and GGDEF domain